MRRTLRKTQDLPFKRFASHRTELDNYIPLFPGFSADKKMLPKDLNEIILHTVLNGWKK